MLLSVFHDEVWLPSCENLRECTMVGYESAWRCHIVDAFGGLEIDSITADMIETWMAGMPRGAARKAWGVLRTMLRKAFRWGVSSVDVTTRVMGPKRTDHQPRVLDARQIAALLRGFWGHELEAWLICSATLGSGLRRRSASNGRTSTCAADWCGSGAVCNGYPATRSLSSRRPICRPGSSCSPGSRCFVCG